jgi:hypothetical protein
LTFWLGDFARTQSSAIAALDMGDAIADTRSQAFAHAYRRFRGGVDEGPGVQVRAAVPNEQ